jgi:hypothetical protein
MQVFAPFFPSHLSPKACVFRFLVTHVLPPPKEPERPVERRRKRRDDSNSR